MVVSGATCSTATAAKIAAVLPVTSLSMHVLRLLLECEYPQRSARRHFRQPLVPGEQRVDPAIAAGNGDILHAVLLPRHRLPFDAGAGLELPELLAAIGVKGFELSRQLPGEDDAAG